MAEKMTIAKRIRSLNPVLLLILTLLAVLGFIMLYDAAQGNMRPWSQAQLVRFLMGLPLMVAVAVMPMRLWLRYAYAFYILSLLLLMLVDVMGHIGMGARRWLNLYFFKIQPSEFMRISLILVLACYFHRRTLEEIRPFTALFWPMLLIGVPVLLTVRQPDLGTAIMLGASGILVLFAAGVPLRYFIGGLGFLLSALPFLWYFLHDYQKKRVLTFLNPERDPFGSGYHILQSKIAIGSGGLVGKGFGQGTQSHLNFLPEKQTDFIFTMFAEEFGFVGVLALLFLFVGLLAMGIMIALRCTSTFGRLLAMGVVGTLFFYAFINIAMVSGLLPVVGVPLPFVSYGGTALLTLMISCGFLLNADLNRDLVLKRYP